MSSIILQLPAVGAKADVSELQFITALHQSGKQTRNDGSLVAKDISRFLSSRYGIKMKAPEKILSGIGLIEGKESTMQLPEIVSILMVPFLLKARGLIEDGAAIDSPVKRFQAKNLPSQTSDLDQQEFKRKCELSAQLTDQSSGEIVNLVLDIMLQDITRRRQPILNPELLQAVLKKFGLFELANDQLLLEEMIKCIGSSAVLNAQSFIAALTHDVLLFDISREVESTTNYFDVFRTSLSAGGILDFENTNKIINKISHWNDTNSCLKCDSTVDMEGLCTIQDIGTNTAQVIDELITTDTVKNWTSSSIDSSVDNMRSKVLLVLLLLGFFMATNSHYIFIDTWADTLKQTCNSENNAHTPQALLCQMGIATGVYFVQGLVYGFLGWLYVGLGSLGNTVRERSFTPICISIGTIVSANLYFLLEGPNSIVRDGNLPPIELAGVTIWSNSNLNYATYFGHYLSIALGFLAIGLQLKNILRIASMRNIGKTKHQYSILFTNRTVAAEAKLKQASSRKINSLVNNAMEIHKRARKHSFDPDKDLRRRAMKTFRACSAESEKTTKKISVFWTLKRILSGELLAEEGIWISSRAFAANCFQIAAIVWFLMLILSTVMALTATAANRSCDSCGPIYANDHAIKISAIVGAVCGVLNMIFIASRYIPMYIATVLQFRYGLNSSLGDDGFSSYRNDIHNARLILGYSFWGPIVSSCMIAMVITGIIYCFIDPNLQDWAIRYLSALVGNLIAIGCKVLMLFAFQKQYMGGFYRKHPADANFIGLFFECWNLFLALGYSVFRAIKVLVIAILHVGRIDTPVLAKRNTVLKLSAYFVSVLHALPFALATSSHKHQYAVFFNNRIYNRRFSTSVLHSRLFIT